MADLLTQKEGFTNAQDAVAFALAGNAYFTIKSLKSGDHFTYRVAQCEDKLNLWFVSVLTGSDNNSNYTYIGTIRSAQATVRGDAVFAHGRKSKIGIDAPSVKAFTWTWRYLIEMGMIPEKLEVRHEGRCGRCGKRLTVPESIDRGIGPDCASKMECV